MAKNRAADWNEQCKSLSTNEVDPTEGVEGKWQQTMRRVKDDDISRELLVMIGRLLASALHNDHRLLHHHPATGDGRWCQDTICDAAEWRDWVDQRHSTATCGDAADGRLRAGSVGVARDIPAHSRRLLDHCAFDECRADDSCRIGASC